MKTIKGEMVLIVEGIKRKEDDLPADALRTLAHRPEDALKTALAAKCGVRKMRYNQQYALGRQEE